MERRRKLFIAKTAVIVGSVMVFISAHEYGPDAGYVNVPGENGTCAQSGCHVGTANSGQGSVTVAFPNGLTYAPGVTQHLVVTIADPATTQIAWGFQLTARASNNTQSQAGGFASSDANTLVMCATTNLAQEQEEDFSASKAQSCPVSPVNMPLQYVEHSLTGYNTTRGHKGSQSFDFDWTPPSASVGNIVVYVAGNAANGDLTVNGDHIYTKTYTLTAGVAGPPPAIDSGLTVQNQTSAPNAKGQPVAAGSLVALYGTNFATAAAAADTIPLSTKLSNVSVTFNGVAAPMVGIAPNLKIGSQTLDQINAIVPWGVQPGTAQVVVTTSGGSSPAVSVPVASTGPGIFYIATDSTGVNRPLVYNNSDNTFSYPAGIFGTNLKTRPASIQNDIVVLWCTGLGPVTVTPPDGAPATDAKGNFVESDTTTKPVVTVGSIPATVLFSGLTQYPSIYQVNLKLAASTPIGDAEPIQIQMNNVTTTDQLKIAVTK